MLERSVVFLLALFVGFQHGLSTPPEKGILVRPIKVDKGFVGEPGQVVTYSYVDSRKLDIWVTLNDTTRFNVFEHYVIPYDSIFAPSRIYLLLLEDPFQVFGTEDVMQQARGRYLLAKNTCSEFPHHPLYENLFALLSKHAADYELGFTDQTQQSITIARDYLQKFPHGTHRDEIEWRLIQLEHRVFEYEGFAAGPLADSKLYEGFLSSHPKSLVADQIKLHIAYLCRVITESLEDDLEKNDGFVKEDIQQYRLKALKIYRQLLESDNITVRETARVAIYNIEHGRTAYVGATDW
jgi:hypothetical protein